MIWTIACNGTEKTLADWGLKNVRRKLVSAGQDEFTFTADGTAADAAPLFVPYGPSVTLWRNRTQNSDGTFAGGTQWFQGIVTHAPRAGAPDAESMQYKVAGPWWYLDNRVFQQPYQNVFLGYSVPNDPTTPPTYGVEYSSHLFLNQGVNPGPNPGITKITNGQQIIEALNWCLKPFTDINAAAPFQIGTVTPVVDVPIEEVRDVMCADIIRKMLRWSPDAVAWFDYSTTPPTFNCKLRTQLTVVNLDVSQT